MNNENKIIIYQVFTRLFGNNNKPLRLQWRYSHQRLRKNGGFYSQST